VLKLATINKQPAVIIVHLEPMMKSIVVFLIVIISARMHGVARATTPFDLLDSYVKQHSKERFELIKTELFDQRFVSAGYSCPNQVLRLA
jgi:hypothetical protein